MRRLTSALALALSALLLAGCSVGGASSDSVVAPEPGMDVADEQYVAGEGGPLQSDTGAIEPGTDTDQQLGSVQSIITTGYLSVTVEAPLASADEAAGIATGLGGRVDNRSESPANEYQSERATLTLRIPSDRYDDAVEALRDLGDTTSYQTDSADVTQQRTDLAARVDVLEASVERLTTLLGQAESTADLIAIESELTARQAELDGLTQQLDLLVDQVDYSTLSVDFVTEDLAPANGPDDFWSGVVAGWNGLIAFFGSAVIALGVLLPWVAMLALVGAIVVGVVLAFTRRRRRANRADAASARPEPTADASTRAPDENTNSTPETGHSGDPRA